MTDSADVLMSQTKWGTYQTKWGVIVPYGWTPPPDTIAVAYDPATGIAKAIDQDGDLPDNPNVAGTHQPDIRQNARAPRFRGCSTRHRSASSLTPTSTTTA